jgi:hypothetical protein
MSKEGGKLGGWWCCCCLSTVPDCTATVFSHQLRHSNLALHVLLKVLDAVVTEPQAFLPGHRLR